MSAIHMDLSVENSDTPVLELAAQPLDTIAGDVAEKLNERLEKELLGAWRAGYELLHVYEEPQHFTYEPPEAWTISQYVLPAMKRWHRPEPPGLRYKYSYDLTSVPDEVLRKAQRGEL